MQENLKKKIKKLITKYFHSSEKYGRLEKGPITKYLIYNPSKRHEIWRFFTYMFVHIGYKHLLINVLIQFILGIFVESIHGSIAVVLVFIAGVIAGSIGSSIATPGLYLGGASGGCYALIAANLTTFITNWADMNNPILLLLLFVFWIVADIGESFYRKKCEQPNPALGYRTGHMCHLCGGIAGLLVGVLAFRNPEVHEWEVVLSIVFIVSYFILILIGICVHLFKPGRFRLVETQNDVQYTETV